MNWCLTLQQQHPPQHHTQVKTLQSFRKQMPAEVLVCKNTLMRIAADRVEGFSPLKEATKVGVWGVWVYYSDWRMWVHTHLYNKQGDNAWVFVQEDQIAESVKVYLDFEKTLSAGLSKEAKEV